MKNARVTVIALAAGMVLAASCCSAAGMPVVSRSGKEPMEIKHKVLFFDDAFIETMQSLRRTMHPAVKHDANPVLRADKPWEVSDRKNGVGIVHVYGTVLNEGAVFKIWYQVYPRSGKLYWVCYATSEDGITWKKPALDLVPYAKLKRGDFTEEEVKGNNIVLVHSGLPGATMACSPTVSVAPGEKDPSRRYKMFFWDFGVRYYEPGQFMGACAAFSPDGIRWTPHPGNPVLVASDVTDATWDPVGKRYIAHYKLYELLPEPLDPAKPVVRTPPAEFVVVGRRQPKTSETGVTIQAYLVNETLDKAPLGTMTLENCARIRDRRVVTRAESKDFVTWTDCRVAVVPDARDPPRLETYGMSAFRYESLYVGLLRIMTGQTIDVQLAYSYDDVAWHRCHDRAPFIARGPAGWDRGMVLTASQPVRVGDELWIYYGGWSKEHHEWGDTAIGIARLRVDGFVSLDAGGREGSLLTRPVTVSGSRLLVNADAGTGAIAAELLDENGRVIPGFGRADCLPLTGDRVEGEIRWRAKKLESLAGRTVRVRFFLRDTKFYAFQLL